MRCLIAILLISVSHLSFGQQVEFTAKATVDKVPKGGSFEVEFSLINSDASGFTPPDFRGFRVLSGPMQSYRTSIVNGRRSSSVSYLYTILAEKEGSYTIQSATIQVKGRKLSSNQIKIEVLPSRSQGTNIDAGEDVEDIFLMAQTDTSQVYIGQQVVIFYKLYTKINVENYNIISESKYNGCYAQALDAYREPVLKEVVNGEEYSTKVLRKVAVFPQQSGKIEIEPLHVRIGIPKRDPRFRGFFSSFNLRSENLSSNPLTLHVGSPFDGAPKAFTGAVGQFRVMFQMLRTQATTDDALSLRIHIRGNGDIKTIRPPDLDLPAAFEVYDAKTLSERMINATDSVRGEKSFDFICLVSQPDTYQFQPTFTYLDPALDSFVTVSDTFTVRILPGRSHSITRADNDLVENVNGGYRGIMPALKLSRNRAPLFVSAWYWGSYALPVLGFMLLMWRNKIHQKSNEEKADAVAVARERLEGARVHLDNRQLLLFYEEVALSIKQLISQKLNVDASEFSRSKIHSILDQHGLDKSHISKVDVLLERCDYELYSGGSSQHDLKKSYEQAVDILSVLASEI